MPRRRRRAPPPVGVLRRRARAAGRRPRGSTSPTRCRSAASSPRRSPAATSAAWPSSSSSAEDRAGRGAGPAPAVGPGRGDHRRPPRREGRQRRRGGSLRRPGPRAGRRADAGTPGWPAPDDASSATLGRAPPGQRLRQADRALAALRTPHAARRPRRGQGPAAPDPRPCATPARPRSTSTSSTTRRRTSRSSCSGDWAATIPDVQLGCVVQAYRKDAHADLRDLIAWSATDAPRPTAGPPGEGRLLGRRDDRRQRQRLAVAGVRAARPRPTPTTSAAPGSCTTTPARCGPPSPATTCARSPTRSPYARRRELGPTRLELQLLYGMAEPVHAALVRDGHRVRVYAPVGELVPGMAYLVRRLLENTSNESFVRHRFAEGRDLDELVRAGRRRAIARRAAGRAAPARDRPGARRRRSPTSRVAELAAAGARAALTGARRRCRGPARLRRARRSSTASAVATDRDDHRRSIRAARPRRVPRARCADRATPTPRSPSPRRAWPAWRRRAAGRAGRGPVPGGGDPARAPASSWRRWRSSRPASRGRGRRRRVRGDRLLRVLRPRGAPPRRGGAGLGRSPARPTDSLPAARASAP